MTRTQLSPSALARLAGVLYLIITVAAIIAHFYVPSQLIVPGDTATTAANIAAQESLFRFGAIGGELIVLLSEVILSIVLYVLLKPVSKTLSLLAATARLVMTAIHGLNLINYYFILILLRDESYLSVFSLAQQQALIGLFLEAHSYGFTLGIAFLTIHVLALGWLILQSGYFPRVLGVLFIIAGLGYTFDSVGLLLVPSYQTTPGLIALAIALAEIAFPVWLLIKGVNPEGWQNRTRLQPAAV